MLLRTSPIIEPDCRKALFLDMSPTALELILRISITKLQILRNSMQPTTEVTVLRMTSTGEKTTVAGHSEHSMNQPNPNHEHTKPHRVRQRSISNGLFRSLMITIIGRKARAVLIHEQMKNKTMDVHRVPTTNTTSSSTTISNTNPTIKFGVQASCGNYAETASQLPSDNLSKNSPTFSAVSSSNASATNKLVRSAEGSKRPGAVLNDENVVNPKQRRRDSSITPSASHEQPKQGERGSNDYAVDAVVSKEVRHSHHSSVSSQHFEVSVSPGLKHTSFSTSPGNKSVSTHPGPSDMRMAVLDRVPLRLVDGVI